MRRSGAERRKLKRLAEARAGDARPGAPGRCLAGWSREARRRAGSLDAPPAWELAASCRPLADALDPSGELAADLDRTCAEAVAGAAGPHLAGVSRPLADRARLSARGDRR